MKDFNSIVSLSEALEKSLVVRFSTPGSPLIVTTHSDEHDTLTLELIIATLPEGSGTLSQRIPENQHAGELGNTEHDHQWGEERYFDTTRYDLPFWKDICLFCRSSIRFQECILPLPLYQTTWN